MALGWTEESVAAALALSVRQIRRLRLLANVFPGMLEHMARGDMPSEQQLRTIAAAGHDEQAEVWKKYKPKKQEHASWWEIARALTKTRMLAKDASFGDDLAQAYGIVWQEDLFAPADEDSRYTTDIEAFLGAQQEWLSNNLPKRGAIIEVNDWGQPKLPAKASQIYSKPERLSTKGSRAPIEDDMLIALLILAFAGVNVTIASGSSDNPYGHADCRRHAARLLIDGEGRLSFDRDTLQQVARSVLIDVMSCRRNRSDSGITTRIAR